MIPHPFSPQEYDNAEMDQDSKPLQHRKDQRVARGRAVKKHPQVRLTPTEILKLLPSPVVLPDRSLTALEHRLDQRRQRLCRLMAHRTRKEIVLVVPQRINSPSLVTLERLERDIATIPTRRKLLTRAQYKIHMDALLRMKGVIVAVIRKVQAAENYRKQERYLARVGQIFLDAPVDVLESFIVGRRPGRKRHRQRRWGNASPTQH
jgi:hypothetical protein